MRQFTMSSSSIDSIGVLVVVEVVALSMELLVLVEVEVGLANLGGDGALSRLLRLPLIII